jgi:glycerol dehydrogenase-like iron-containing ADH family enzyme
VLVIADNLGIAQRATAWADGFASLGRIHRVRLVSRATADVEGLVAEALQLEPTAIVAAGGEAARHVGKAVAMRLGLPLAIDDGELAFPDK